MPKTSRGSCTASCADLRGGRGGVGVDVLLLLLLRLAILGGCIHVVIRAGRLVEALPLAERGGGAHGLCCRLGGLHAAVLACWTVAHAARDEGDAILGVGGHRCRAVLQAGLACPSVACCWQNKHCQPTCQTPRQHRHTQHQQFAAAVDTIMRSTRNITLMHVTPQGGDSHQDQSILGSSAQVLAWSCRPARQ